MNYLKPSIYSHLLQASLLKLMIICFNWYRDFAPAALKHRRNVKQCHVSDVAILALLLWQTELGIESQKRFYRTCVEDKYSISRSRFNRRARQLEPFIKLINLELNQEVDLSDTYLVVDSFPMPLCQPVRNLRAKLFKGIADIGYKATKKTHYYGFKAHFIASDDGYLLGYVVTKASVHDARELPELIANVSPENRLILGDEGYIGKHMHNDLRKQGYIIWTPYRRNMKDAKKHNDHLLMADRRTIETEFSELANYNAENDRARCLIGYQERLDLAVLASNMSYCMHRFKTNN